MHAVTYGITRDQMMARHKSNHIQVAYANTAEDADQAMLAKQHWRTRSAWTWPFAARGRTASAGETTLALDANGM